MKILYNIFPSFASGFLAECAPFSRRADAALHLREVAGLTPPCTRAKSQG